MMTRIGVRMGRQVRSCWRNSILVACGVAWGLAWFAGLAAASAGAQSAEVGKILSQYAKAEGGGGKLGKVVTLQLDGTVTEINGKAPVDISDVKAAGGGGAAANAGAGGSGGDGCSGRPRPGAGRGAGRGASGATHQF